jgi:hypothetical protein
MKHIVIVFIYFLVTIECNGRNSDLLSFFNTIKEDSIVNTLDIGRKSIKGKIIDDILVIRYFLENKEENLYYIVEEYDMDDNTYSDVTYKRQVFGLFSKKIDSTVLICYNMDGIYFLSIFNTVKDAIVSTYKFRESPDEDESFTQSILFSNYIFTIETESNTHIKLVKIDYPNGKFIEHKNIIMDDFMIIEDVNPNNEKYQKALKLIGISENGELIETIE